MTMADPEFRFNIEWLPASGVRSPELRATWARFEIHLNNESLSNVEDVGSGTTIRSLFLPLYPLAEWVAHNWWYLQHHSRPANVPIRYWTFRHRARIRGARSEWLTHHNLRAVGDGFPWPDLTLVPTETSVQLAWRGDRSAPPGWTVRFLSDGEAEVDKAIVRNALSQLVDDVLTRLRESGVDQTELEEEWEAVRSMEPDEVRFCLAAAALGLDPFVLDDDITRLILLADECLADDLEQDFLAAADPNRLAEDLRWIEHNSGLIDSSLDKTAELPLIRPAVDGPPWRRGAQHATALREALAVAETEPFEVEPWVMVTPVDQVDPSLEALGGFSKRGARVLALAGRGRHLSKRFSAGRSLYRFVVDSQVQHFLITGARTLRQQAERAFAAELLAPAQGIHKLIPLHADYLDADDVVAISEHFNVSEWVVRYQVLNHLDIAVDEPMSGLIS